MSRRDFAIAFVFGVFTVACSPQSGSELVGETSEAISCETCYGAVGSNCDTSMGATKDSSGKYWTAWVSAGSEAHDTCCHFNPNGHMCGGSSDNGACSNEWNAAVGDWGNGTQFQRHYSTSCWGGNFDLAGIVQAADGNWVVQPHSGAIYPRMRTDASIWWDHDAGGGAGASCSGSGGVWCKNGWSGNCGGLTQNNTHSCGAQMPNTSTTAVTRNGVASTNLVAKDVVNNLTGLWAGQAVWDPNGCHELTMQTDGNLVLYNYCTGGNAIWSSRTNGTGAKVMYVQDDGNVVVYDQYAKTAYWATGTDHNWTNVSLAVQNDGNLVVYRNSDGAALWSSHTNGR